MEKNNKKLARDLLSLLIPKKANKTNSGQEIKNIKAVSIIPTYKPTLTAVKLIEKLSEWHPYMQVIVVDDSTPPSSSNIKYVNRIKDYARLNNKITYLRTPKNLLKAGALNFGLKHIRKNKVEAQVVLTLDDDVIINKKTIPNLIKKLICDRKTGAVCGYARVRNKNKNLLTRLQALEYYGFNVTKLGDNGFFDGPLVMQGMMVAFRREVINKVKNFDQKNLIEDYEITVRIKKAGYNVLFVNNSQTYTKVPENIRDLWKQRVRWTYGGLTVIEKHKRNFQYMIQDIIGHGFFLSLLSLIFLSFLVPRENDLNPILVKILIISSITQFTVAYIFHLWTFRDYKDKDPLDYLIRLTLIPELIYSNLLSLVLMGSYLFYIFNKSLSKSKRLFPLYKQGLFIFEKLGYSLTWGTKTKEVF